MSWARGAHWGGLWLFLTALFAQFFLAGAGAFGAASFDSHSALGFFLLIGSLVLLVLAALGRVLVRLTAFLFALMVVQSLLGAVGSEEEAWLGAFHGLNAPLVVGLTIMLVTRAHALRGKVRRAAAG